MSRQEGEGRGMDGEGRRSVYLSAYPSFLSSSGLCAVPSARICVPSCAVVQMRSRLVQAGCDVRRPLPSRARPTGGCESIVFFHTDTLAKSPHRHTPPVTRIRTHANTGTVSHIYARTHSRGPRLSCLFLFASSSSSGLLLLLPLLLLIAASRH